MSYLNRLFYPKSILDKTKNIYIYSLYGLSLGLFFPDTRLVVEESEKFPFH